MWRRRGGEHWALTEADGVGRVTHAVAGRQRRVVVGCPSALLRPRIAAETELTLQLRRARAVAGAVAVVAARRVQPAVGVAPPHLRRVLRG